MKKFGRKHIRILCVLCLKLMKVGKASCRRLALNCPKLVLFDKDYLKLVLDPKCDGKFIGFVNNVSPDLLLH